MSLLSKNPKQCDIFTYIPWLCSIRYDEIIIVSTAVIVTIETTSLLTYPIPKAIAIIINENSLTCAEVIPVMKLVFFLYPNKLIKTIIINGSNIITNIESIILGTKTVELKDNPSVAPSMTKNMVMKKFLNGFILLLISIE